MLNFFRPIEKVFSGCPQLRVFCARMAPGVTFVRESSVRPSASQTRHRSNRHNQPSAVLCPRERCLEPFLWYAEERSKVARSAMDFASNELTHKCFDLRIKVFFLDTRLVGVRAISQACPIRVVALLAGNGTVTDTSALTADRIGDHRVREGRPNFKTYTRKGEDCPFRTRLAVDAVGDHVEGERVRTETLATAVFNIIGISMGDDTVVGWGTSHLWYPPLRFDRDEFTSGQCAAFRHFLALPHASCCCMDFETPPRVLSQRFALGTQARCRYVLPCTKCVQVSFETVVHVEPCGVTTAAYQTTVVGDCR